MKNLFSGITLLTLILFQTNGNAQIQYALNLRFEYPTVGFSDGKIVPELVGNYPNPVEYHIQNTVGTYITSDSLVDLSEANFANAIDICVVDITSSDTIGYASAFYLGFSSDLDIVWNSFAGPMSSFVCDGHFHGDVLQGFQDSTFVTWATSYDQYGISQIDLPKIWGLDMTDICNGYYNLVFSPISGPTILSTFVYIEPLTANSSSINAEVFTTPSATDFCSGAAISTVSGGVSPYQFFWDLQPGTDQVSLLCPGLHSLKVIDAIGDSTMILYGIADSGSFYDYVNTSLTIDDTIYFMTENCGINYSVPIDSIAITFIDFYTDSTVAMGFNLWQGSNIYYVQDTASYGPPVFGTFLIDLTQFCLNKALGGQVIQFRTTTNYFLSVDESEKNEFIIYPNPTNGKINITGTDIGKIQLYNLLGELILESTDVVIDLSSFTSGLYQVIIFDSNGEKIGVKKIIVEN